MKNDNSQLIYSFTRWGSRTFQQGRKISRWFDTVLKSTSASELRAFAAHPILRFFSDNYIFLLLTISLFFVMASLVDLQAENLSYGDHASNSMLVLKAKAFDLLHGNYSRLGFYHPGPFYFYAMALGEIIFFDWLPVSESPEGAHLISIFIVNISLLACIYSLFRSFGLNGAFASLVSYIGVLISITAAPALSSLWPPHLYILPAYLWIVSLAMFISGRTDVLWASFLAGGILVHGHASQIGLVPIMFVLAVGLFFLFSHVGKKCLDSPNIRAMPWRVWVPIVIIFGVFFLPYALNTILNWPGETPRYFGQSGANRNGVFEAGRYILQYWEGWNWLLGVQIAIFALFLLRPRKFGLEACASRSIVLSVMGLIGAFIVTTSAMLLYAVFGVDDLSADYIGFWYLGAVAGLLATGVSVLLVASAEPIRQLVFVLGTILMVIAWPNRAILNGAWPMNNDTPKAERILAAIMESADGRPINWEIDTSDAWPTVWPTVAGLLEYNARTSALPVCINASSWHLLFHKENLCTDVEVLSNNTATYVFTTRELANDRYLPLDTPLRGTMVYYSIDGSTPAW